MHIIDMLAGMRAAVRLPGVQDGDDQYILVLNSENRKLNVEAFTRTSTPSANDRYLELEEQYRNNPEIQVVLVSVDSIKSLSKAYPNYFLDTSEFIKLVQRIEEGTLFRLT
jgi:hypothetical protein